MKEANFLFRLVRCSTQFASTNVAMKYYTKVLIFFLFVRGLFLSSFFELSTGKIK